MRFPRATHTRTVRTSNSHFCGRFRPTCPKQTVRHISDQTFQVMMRSQTWNQTDVPTELGLTLLRITCHSKSHAETQTRRPTCSFRFCQRPHGLSSKISLSSSLSSSFPSDPDFLSGTDIVILPLFISRFRLQRLSASLLLPPCPVRSCPRCCCGGAETSAETVRGLAAQWTTPPPPPTTTPVALSPLGAQNMLQRKLASLGAATPQPARKPTLCSDKHRVLHIARWLKKKLDGVEN